MHIILPDFTDYKSLKLGPKDKVVFIAPEDGNSFFSAEALILCSKTKSDIINVKSSSKLQIAYELGKIVGSEKGDVIIHSSDSEMAELTGGKKPVVRAHKKLTAAAPKESLTKIPTPMPATKVPETEIEAESAKQKKPRAKASEQPSPKTIKANDSVVIRLLKSNGLDNKYMSLISEQVKRDGASEITIDTYVRTAAAVAGATNDEAVKLGELAKKHWNEIIR